jgi:anti-sigma factor RsiW
MDKSQLQELIQADLDGELSVAERADLARLLLQDPEARRLHEEFRRTDQLLRNIAAAEPPPGLRAAILAGSAQSVRPGNTGQRQYGLSLYRMAAVILGGLLIAGLSYVLIDAKVPGTELQGSLIAPQGHLSLRAEGAEVSASLRRDGEMLRLELNSSTTIPCEIVARIDPATTTFVGKTGDAALTTASGAVTVVPATGSQAIVLDFSGATPIQLELRAGGRLLGEGSLSVSNAR